MRYGSLQNGLSTESIEVFFCTQTLRFDRNLEFCDLKLEFIKQPFRSKDSNIFPVMSILHTIIIYDVSNILITIAAFASHPT